MVAGGRRGAHATVLSGAVNAWSALPSMASVCFQVGDRGSKSPGAGALCVGGEAPLLHLVAPPLLGGHPLLLLAMQ